MFRVTDSRILPCLLFFVLAVFPPAVSDSFAIKFEAIYEDAQGTGFYDETPLSEAHIARLRADGVNARPGTTLGEARRAAFNAVLGLFENLLVGDNTVRVAASFKKLPPGALAGAMPSDVVYSKHPSGSSIAVTSPVALAENVLKEELNGSKADIEIQFNETRNFYYGISQEILQNPFAPEIFVLIAVHEIMHGLGFFGLVQVDGSFPTALFESGETLQTATIYDLSLFSERDNAGFLSLSEGRRQSALTSETGLLWDGTLSKEFRGYSCAQIVGKFLLRESGSRALSAIDNAGRPRLHAPANYKFGSSVSHLHENTGELMAANYNNIQNGAFSFSVLGDLGWQLNGNFFNFFPKALQDEFLKNCTIGITAEPEPTSPAPAPAPETTTPATPTSSRSGGGGGCAVSGTGNAPQSTAFNLGFIVFVLVSIALWRNRAVFQSGSRPRHGKEKETQAHRREGR